MRKATVNISYAAQNINSGLETLTKWKKYDFERVCPQCTHCNMVKHQNDKHFEHSIRKCIFIEEIINLLFWFLLFRFSSSFQKSIHASIKFLVITLVWVTCFFAHVVQPKVEMSYVIVGEGIRPKSLIGFTLSSTCKRHWKTMWRLGNEKYPLMKYKRTFANLLG